MVKMFFPSGLQRELMSQMTGGILKTEQEMDGQIDAALMQQERFSEEKAEPQAKEFNLPFILCSSPLPLVIRFGKSWKKTRCWLQATNITFLWWGWPWRCGYESRHQKQAQSWVDVEYNQEASSIPFSADFPAIHNCQVSKAVGECFKMPMEEFYIFVTYQDIRNSLHAFCYCDMMDAWTDGYIIFFSILTIKAHTLKRDACL